MLPRVPSAVLALAVAASGCVVAPPRVDPFAGLTLTNAAYRGMTVALLLSENTKNSLRYTNELGARGADTVGTKAFQDHRGPVGEAGEKAFPSLVDLLQKQFKAVVKVERPEDARGVGADAVVLLDIVMDLPHVQVFPPSTTDAKIDLGAVFMDLDGRRLDSLSASGRRTPGYPRTPGKMAAAVEGARDEALKRFAEALLSSARLAEFAAPKAPAAAALAAASVPRPSVPRPVSAVDRPSYRASARPENFAVVVGIEKYMNVPDAPYAERDAEAVRAHLLALGYPERNVVFLTGPRASAAGIKKNVETWLPNNVTEKSTVFFFYSGHGAPDPKSGRAYLVPVDGDPQYLEDTAYPIERLYRVLGGLKAKRVVVAMDSCFSGAGGRSVLAKGLRPLVVQVEPTVDVPGKLVSFTASGAGEVSGTSEDEGHGLFTYFFLKGLGERGPDATAQALFDGLKSSVQDHARRDNREQTPQLLLAGPDADGPLR